MSSIRMTGGLLTLALFSFGTLGQMAFGQAVVDEASANSPAMKEGMKPSAGEGSGKKQQSDSFDLKLAQGKLTFSVPGAWKKAQVRSRILEAELKVPAADQDQQDGRVTIMPAGGSIPANIARWEGQFAQPSGDATEANTEVETISGKKVHLVDITGTFQDSMGRGPFAGGQKVARDDYRMLAAIIEMEREPDAQYVNNYFFKFIGPKGIVDANAERFLTMLRSMQSN